MTTTMLPRAKQFLVGTMLRISRNPAAAHIAKNAGLDFIMADMEHGDYSFETLAVVCGAARAAGLRGLVRVPELARGYVSRALDCGADGVMAPMVESEDQARNLVAWAKYPPLGKRGLSSFGAHSGFLKIGDTNAFMARSNDNVMTIAQIETAAGIESVDKIAAVSGIDALLVGPNDLAVALGCAGDLDCDLMNKAIAQVAEAARRRARLFGLHAPVNLIKKWMPRDLRLVMISTDLHMLAEGMQNIVEKMKAVAT